MKTDAQRIAKRCDTCMWYFPKQKLCYLKWETLYANEKCCKWTFDKGLSHQSELEVSQLRLTSKGFEPNPRKKTGRKAGRMANAKYLKLYKKWKATGVLPP